MTVSKPKLRQFFATFSAARVKLPAAEGNLYETFVFLHLCQSARAAGFRVAMVSQGGTYRVRASPGWFGGGFGFAVLQRKSGPVYELHNGIQFGGNSLMEHEADIVLVEAGQPPGTGVPSELIAWVECKYYDSPSRLKGEVRKAIGAVLDLSCSTHASARGFPQGCIHCGCRFHPFFVTNVDAGRRRDIERFLATYDVNPMFEVKVSGAGLAPLRSTFQSLFAGLP
jgi:hypothetical protein